MHFITKLPAKTQNFSITLLLKVLASVILRESHSSVISLKGNPFLILLSRMMIDALYEIFHLCIYSLKKYECYISR